MNNVTTKNGIFSGTIVACHTTERSSSFERIAPLAKPLLTLLLVALRQSRFADASVAGATLLVSLVALGLVATTVRAESVRNEFFSRSETRISRTDARETGIELYAFSRAIAAPVPAPIVWVGSVGVSYTDGQDNSRTWLTPFEIDAKLNEKATLKVTADGYEHTKADSGSASGFTDPTFAASYAVIKDPESKSLVRVAAGFTLPVGGNVGSTSAKERLSAVYAKQLNDRWGVLVSGKLTRRNQDPAPGVSRYSRTGLLQATYTFADAPDSDVVSHDFQFQFVRDFRSGVGGTSLVGATYDFPVSKKLGGAVTLTRGLTNGSRDTTVEFDLSFPF